MEQIQTTSYEEIYARCLFADCGFHWWALSKQVNRSNDFGSRDVEAAARGTHTIRKTWKASFIRYFDLRTTSISVVIGISATWLIITPSSMNFNKQIHKVLHLLSLDLCQKSAEGVISIKTAFESSVCNLLRVEELKIQRCYQQCSFRKCARHEIP